MAFPAVSKLEVDIVLQTEAFTPSCGPARPAAPWTCIPAALQLLTLTAFPAVSKLDMALLLETDTMITLSCGPARPPASWTCIPAVLFTLTLTAFLAVSKLDTELVLQRETKSMPSCGPARPAAPLTLAASFHPITVPPMPQALTKMEMLLDTHTTFPRIRITQYFGRLSP